MTNKTRWESVKAEGTDVAKRIRALIAQGNLRRVVVERNGATIAEFPLTAGVVAAMVAPLLAAVGAMVMLVKDCTIHMELAPEPAGVASTAGPAEHAAVDVEC